MAKPDKHDLRIVSSLLRQAGLSVQPVEEADTKRCDLRAVYGTDEAYRIEVKGFKDDEEIDRTLRRGELYSKSAFYNKSNAVADAVHDAVKQLESTPATTPGEFRLIALLTHGRSDEKLLFQQAIGVLCGKRSIVTPTEQSDKSNHLECLYFGESAFYKYRKALDAAVLIYGDGATLFVNDHGVNLIGFRGGQLSRFFAAHDSMYDAEMFARQGFLIADCNLDRRDEGRVLEYVTKKYNLSNAHVLNFQAHSSVALVK